MTPRVISEPECFEAFRAQLKLAGLPYEDLDKDKHLLVGYYRDEELIGTGGMEIYGDYGLIRSISITASNRGKKLGSKIAFHLIDKAKESELKGIYLLTETAKDFFLKIGFEEVDRDLTPESLRNSSEFAHVCPASATCMYFDLNSKC